MEQLEQLLPILVKLAAAFAGLWAATRILGKRQISQLSPFDFISAMVMGDLVGDTIYDENVNVFMLIFALAVWTSLSYFFDKVMEFSKPLRKKLEGKTDLLIINGEIDSAAMKRNKLEFEELRMMLRQNDVFSISEVAFAIYETNGSLSILRKSAYETVTRSDLKMESPSVSLPVSLIEQGEIQDLALSALGKDRAWLFEQLEKCNHRDHLQILHAEWTEEGELKVIPRYDDADAGKKTSS
ncbi:DUF421 domain-containing protein [Neobacillus mesonae]|nr:DUF421 domain-containing protein [Neobacillus mesonae]